MTKFRVFLLVGGGLLLIQGVLFLASSLTLNYSGEEASSFILFSSAGAITILSAFVVLAGLLGVITGITGRTEVLKITHIVGMRCAVFAVLFFAGAVLFDKWMIQPYFNQIGSWFGASFDTDSSVYMASLMVLSVSLQIFGAAITFSDFGGINAKVITLVATRMIFVIGVVPFAYMYFQASNSIPPYMPAAAFAALYGWFVFLFWFIRNKVDFLFISSNFTILNMIVNTVVCVAALGAYIIAANIVYPIISFVLNWQIIIPIALTAIMVFMTGFKSDWNHETSHIGWFLCSVCKKYIYGRYLYCSDACETRANTPVIRQGGNSITGVSGVGTISQGGVGTISQGGVGTISQGGVGTIRQG